MCGGIGWLRRDLPVEDPGFGDVVACDCRMERFEADRFGRLLRFSNLGGLERVTFDTLTLPTWEGSSTGGVEGAREVAMDFAERPEGWLAIVGSNASVKTQLAAAIANHCLRKGTAVFFISVADLLDHLRAAYAPSSETPFDELFDQVRNVPVLILDDLGLRTSTPWAQEKLSQLLSHRNNSQAPTVITTDVPLDEIDDRLRVRFQDSSHLRVIELGGAERKGGQVIDSLDLGDISSMTFDNFNPTGNMVGPMGENLREAWQLARNFAEQPDGWLMLVGGNGCGKTHLAASIVHFRRSRGDRVLFVFVPDLLDYLRSTFQPDGGSTYSVIDQVKRVPLLILDDLSEPIDTPWAREKLYQILNYRHLTRLPTVITSGVEPELLERRMWARMGDPSLSMVYEIRAPHYRTNIMHKPKTMPDAERSRGRSKGRGQTAG